MSNRVITNRNFITTKTAVFTKRSHSSQVEVSQSSPSKVLEWIRAAELGTGGIRVHSRHAHAYPEVTGYLIPTLLQYGARELAHRLVRWLIAIQRTDGSFTDSEQGESYIFDTGQVLRGLLSAVAFEPMAAEAARGAADYLCTAMRDLGRGGFGNRYAGTVPESVHLYVLPPLMEASFVFNNLVYREAAENCLAYYLAHGDTLRIGDLTHFLAYELEALIDLGRADLALPVLTELRNTQRDDGAVRGIGSHAWVCSPGLAQLAICWYKTGLWEPADKAISWLEAHQQSSGGFLGSYGRGATYFPDAEPSWAAKFYLDAHLLRVAAFFERNAHVFPATVSSADGRSQAVLALVRPADRVLEVGCGKGRFLSAIHTVYPNTDCTGVDISPALLSCVPANIRTLRGALESIPSPSDNFDVVFSVEAIEHSSNPEAAVAEMIRVTKPGGWVIIIDKQQLQWGRLDCAPWEHWPVADNLRQLLARGCDRVTVESIGYDDKPASDGLMVAWCGQKRSRLSGTEWSDVLLSPTSMQSMLARIRSNQLTEWGQAVILATQHGEKVLEIGSGTGEISLHLAQGGRHVTALDYSPANLIFTARAATELGVSIRTVHADATQPLPFQDDEFDCTWSAGLLEHFTVEERRQMLREWGRVTVGAVINLVPNAACLAYRSGKVQQEKCGVWAYGLETPILSLRDDYAAAGLQVTKEFSVGAKHALSFLPADDPLRQALSAWFENLSEAELHDCNQGYLVVTIGHKVRRASPC